jgi:hypothetical protein
MSTYYGTPGALASLPLPAATVAIASSTNATPIVVTTSTPHGLGTGQSVIITDHLVNTAANGIWIVVVTGASTFSIYTLAGVAVAGVGVGGASGNVQSLGLPGITLPEDLVTDRDVASVNVPFEALADMTAWLAYRVLANMRILRGGSSVLATGSTMTAQAGAVVTVNGNLVLDTDGVFNPLFRQDAGTFSLLPPQFIGDAAATVLIADGHTVILNTAPLTARVLTLPAPSRDGLFFDFYLNASSSNPATNYFEIIRFGSANYIARLSGWSSDGATDLGTGCIHIVADGGVWRCGGGVGFVTGTDA